MRTVSPLVVLFAACTTSGESARDTGSEAPSSGARSDADASGATDLGGEGAGSTLANIPRLGPDAGACWVPSLNQPSVVCFGSDPYPYQHFLAHADAAVDPGNCPTASDFLPVGGEGSCGYSACGQLLPSSVSSLPDAGALGIADGGTTACCFVALFVCGV